MSLPDSSASAPPGNLPVPGESPVALHTLRPQDVTGSFDDPAVFQAFVRALYGCIQHKLDTTVDNNLSAEVAGFNRLLTLLPPAIVEKNREFFELAFELLSADRPNLLLVGSIRRDLVETSHRYTGGIVRILSFFSGKTLLNAVLAALLTVIVSSFVFMLAMSGAVKLMFFASSTGQTDLRLLQVLNGPAYNELLIMFHAAFLGSMVSIMVRIKSFASQPTLTPLLAYVSITTRTVVAFFVAGLVFCTIKTGLFSFPALDLNGPNGYYAAWMIGFVCGFSERLSQNFVDLASNALNEGTSKPERQPPAPSGAVKS
jgi:hypothetical protein